MRKKKSLLVILIGSALLLLLGGSVWAFPDAESDPNAAAINALRDAGIVNGGPDGSFQPSAELTYAAGVTMLVNAFELNFDHIRFIKAPETSDYYDHVPEGKWYSDAFIIAGFYLDVPRDVKPDQPVTREQYAHLLYRAVAAKGDFAYPELYMLIDDEAKIAPAYRDSIQKLLVSGIMSLDDTRTFSPGEPIRRGEAAGWLYNALTFVRGQLDRIDTEQHGHLFSDVKLTVKPVNEKVNEVVVSAQAPHPGYGIRIASVVFEGSQAWITIEPIEPDPDMMYPQVITEVSASVYTAAEYEPMLAAQNDDSGGSVSSRPIG